MPEYTDKLNLTKLQDNEYYDGNVENENLDKIDEAIGNRIKKVDGKGLSTEDYTSEEKQKLADIPDDLDTAYASKNHNHDGVYARATHNHDTIYASTAHNHDDVYEPKFKKKSGFNLDKSDSVSSASSLLLATDTAVKTVHDKAVNALNVAIAAQNSANTARVIANKKLEATATAVNANKYKNREDIFHGGNYGNIIEVGGSFTLGKQYINSIIYITGSSPAIITVPVDSAILIGTQITVIRHNGAVTFALASGVSLLSVENKRSIKDKYGAVTLVKISATVWQLFGSLE